MPCPDAREVWEFDAFWTRYRIDGPAALRPLIEEITVTTPRFREPTHEVDYVILADEPSRYRLAEQGDEVGVYAEPQSVSATISSRVNARLHQIAALHEWAPVRGALIESAEGRILVMADDRTAAAIGRVMAAAELDVIGLGTCLLRSGQAAVVGRTPMPAPGRVACALAATPPPVAVAFLDASDDRLEMTPMSTPALIDALLRCLLDPHLLPGSTANIAMKALKAARGWRVPASDLNTTIRVLARHAA